MRMSVRVNSQSHKIHTHPWMEGKIGVTKGLVIVDIEFKRLFEKVVDSIDEGHILVDKEEYGIIKERIERGWM